MLLQTRGSRTTENFANAQLDIPSALLDLSGMDFGHVRRNAAG